MRAYQLTNIYRQAVGISEGVAYLHQNDVVHGDIKGANIFISGEGVAKLADFGCTQLKRGTLYFTTTTNAPALSFRWAAPEILDGSAQLSRESDVYALGMVLLEVVTGMVPFSNYPGDMTVVTAVVLLQQIPERPTSFASFELEHEAKLLWNLMTDTWVRKPSDRPGSSILKRIKRPVVQAPFSAAYFIIYQNVYFLDTLRAIYHVDNSGQYRRVDLKRNPPPARTEFHIGGLSFLLNTRGELLHKLSGEWHWTPTYPDLESAKAEIARDAKNGEFYKF
ncbi:hypothetical protein FRC08_007688 [Ceratobasidium sp. 394]|nr:hypothetical protein FRC08_007688 [Ceratobasidium sp. 394]